MSRVGFYSAGLVAAVLLLFATNSLHSSSAQPSGSTPIGAANILFGDGQVTSDQLSVRAFVPTGSTSTNCLVTFSESNFAVPGLTLFCGQREFHGQQGLLISVFPPQTIPTGLILSMTVYQEHAHGYGPPVLYTGP
jgi:prepilin-type processing-associated H-X9-DG protein